MVLVLYGKGRQDLVCGENPFGELQPIFASGNERATARFVFPIYPRAPLFAVSPLQNLFNSHPHTDSTTLTPPESTSAPTTPSHSPPN